MPRRPYEDLDFADARATGREKLGRGRRGKAFRRTVAGIPTARFRDRFAGMAHHAGLSVIAVDPAYTSRWGAQHWLGALKEQASTGTAAVTGHHVAAVVVGRRGLGRTARRRKDGPRQTPATTAPRRIEAGTVRPEDRTGPTVPETPSHRAPGRTGRTAPVRTTRGITPAGASDASAPTRKAPAPRPHHRSGAERSGPAHAVRNARYGQHRPINLGTVRHLTARPLSVRIGDAALPVQPGPAADGGVFRPPGPELRHTPSPRVRRGGAASARGGPGLYAHGQVCRGARVSDRVRRCGASVRAGRRGGRPGPPRQRR